MTNDFINQVLGSIAQMPVISSRFLTTTAPAEVKRSFRDRLFSRPWRPFKKTRTINRSIPDPAVYVIDLPTYDFIGPGEFVVNQFNNIGFKYEYKMRVFKNGSRRYLIGHPDTLQSLFDQLPEDIKNPIPPGFRYPPPNPPQHMITSRPTFDFLSYAPGDDLLDAQAIGDDIFTRTVNFEDLVKSNPIPIDPRSTPEGLTIDTMVETYLDPGFIAAISKKEFMTGTAAPASDHDQLTLADLQKLVNKFSRSRRLVD